MHFTHLVSTSQAMSEKITRLFKGRLAAFGLWGDANKALEMLISRYNVHLMVVRFSSSSRASLKCNQDRAFVAVT